MKLENDWGLFDKEKVGARANITLQRVKVFQYLGVRFLVSDDLADVNNLKKHLSNKALEVLCRELKGL